MTANQSGGRLSVNKNPEMRSAVVDLVFQYSRVLVVPKSVGVIDAEYLNTYCMILESAYVTAAEVEAAFKYIAVKDRWFPAPGDLIALIIRARERLQDRKFSAMMNSLVLAVHPDGSSRMTRPERVRDGVLIGHHEPDMPVLPITDQISPALPVSEDFRRAQVRKWYRQGADYTAKVLKALENCGRCIDIENDELFTLIEQNE